MTFKKIVCCTDFSDNSDNAFNTALSIAKDNQASLDILHIREPVVNFVFMSGGVSGEDILPPLSSLEREMEKRYGSKTDPAIHAKIIVREGHPSSEIINYLKEVNADLVVTGSAGFSGLGLVVFGSVSRRIAHKSPCNVLIVRQEFHQVD
jgi:nucleotide-binding universal stress UspA family protein